MSENTNAAASQVISVRDFLRMPKSQRPKILLEQEVRLETNTGVTMTLTVKQLTKTQYELFNRRIQAMSPEVPLMDINYAQAHRDPSNTNKIRPAGSYKERDEKDPTYLKEVQEWFTQSCIWLAVYSAADSLGIVETDAKDALMDAYFELSEEFPGPSLLQFSIGAAMVNPGIAIAEELRKQDQLRREYEEADRLLSELEAQAIAAERNEIAPTEYDKEVEATPAPEEESVAPTGDPDPTESETIA